MNAEWTIAAPSWSPTDWTSVVVSYFRNLLGARRTTFLTGQAAESVARKGWLFPRLDTGMRLLEAYRNRTLGRNLLLIDSQYVDLHAARTMIGERGAIVTLVNGGVFQPHDAESQSLASYRDPLVRYEGAHFGLCDAIVIPTRHGARLFLDVYPELEARVFVIPYPVRQPSRAATPWQKKVGVGFFSRPSFENGWDIVKEIEKRDRVSVDIYSERPLRGPQYLQALSKHRAALIPSRTELFGSIAIEAILCGTIPIVPRGLSYSELIEMPSELMLPEDLSLSDLATVEAVIERALALDEVTHARIINRAARHLDVVFERRDTAFRRLFGKER